MARAVVLLDRAAALWALAGGGLLLGVVAITMANVAAVAADRVAGLFGASVSAISGYEELVGLLVGAGAFMLLPYCQLRRGHVVVDLLLRHARPRIRHAVDRTCAGLFAVAAALLAVMLARGAMEGAEDGIASRVLALPDWPFQVPAVLSLALWGLVAARLCLGPPPPADA
ncbi:MAG: TRAP transporter small permease subunit [Rhodospirillaceae bacterium]|nr:TRAP transporter small permease subunit [Rhodospirillaceae bacterium]